MGKNGETRKANETYWLEQSGGQGRHPRRSACGQESSGHMLRYKVLVSLNQKQKLDTLQVRLDIRTHGEGRKSLKPRLLLDPQLLRLPRVPFQHPGLGRLAFAIAALQKRRSAGTKMHNIAATWSRSLRAPLAWPGHSLARLRLCDDHTSTWRFRAFANRERRRWGPLALWAGHERIAFRVGTSRSVGQSLYFAD